MKQDIKLNMDILSDICNNINNYILAVEDIITAATDFHAVLLVQESVSFHTLAEEWNVGVEENANRLKNNLWSVKSLLQSYIEAMKENVAPVDSSQLMRVDSADIYWNLQQIEWKLYGLSDIYSDTFTSYPDYTTKSSAEVEEDEEAWKLLMAEIEAERARREANYNRMQTFRNSFRSKVDSIIEREMDEMWQIYKSNVAEFETTDDAYSAQAELCYYVVSERPVVTVERVADGAMQQITEQVKGLYTLAMVFSPEMQDLYWSGELDEDREQRIRGFYSGLDVLFTDPQKVLDAMVQNVVDIYEEEGLAYTIGYLGIDTLLGFVFTKGAGKVVGTTEDIASASKIIGKVEDVTHAGDALGDIADTAGDIGKVADDVIEGGTDVIETVSKTNPFDLQPTHSPTLSKNKMNALMDDIKVNGIQESIKYVEYNGQKYVVDGHHRLLAAKRLGLTEVPIEKVDLPYAGYNTIDDLLWFE